MVCVGGGGAVEGTLLRYTGNTGCLYTPSTPQRGKYRVLPLRLSCLNVVNIKRLFANTRMRSKFL